MARGLGALFAGLGGGLTGYAQQEQRKRDEMERQRQREYAETLGLFQAGLEPLEQATARTSSLGTALQSAGQALQPTPGMSGIGAALQAASQMPSQDIQRGRRVALGGREFVQPFSRTEEGREVRQLQAEMAEEARTEQRLREREERGFARELERDRAADAARAALARAQMESNERIAGLREQGARTRATGGIQQDILPTVIRNAQELRSITPQDIRAMSPSAVFGAAVAPMMLAEPSVGSLVGAGLANVTGRVLGSGKEQLYAQYIGSVGDAAARLAERIGVLTNQDIARYRAQVTPIIGDSDEVRLRKHENLVSWANYIAGLGQIAQSGELSSAQVEQLRRQAQQIGSGMDERTMFLTWQEQNPKLGTETNPQYVARFRRELGLGGRQ